MPVQAANPGIYETVMSDGVRRAVVIRPDGTFVSLANPARRGEVVRVFVTGLGPTIPSVGTGSLPVPGSDSLTSGQVIVGVNNAGARVVTSRKAPNLIGVSEVAFEVPSDAPTGNDIVLSVAVNVPGDSQTRFSNGSKLPILNSSNHSGADTVRPLLLPVRHPVPTPIYNFFAFRFAHCQ